MATRKKSTTEAPEHVIRVDFAARRAQAAKDAAKDAATDAPPAAAGPGLNEPAPKKRGTRKAAADPATSPAAPAAPAVDRREDGAPATPGPRAPAERAAALEHKAKVDHFSELIREGLVAVTFDTRAPGVKLPPNFAGKPALVLNFSHRFLIEDFGWDELGVRATLSFNDGPTLCDIPWRAVFLLSSEVARKRYAYPASFPPELAAQLKKQLGLP